MLDSINNVFILISSVLVVISTIVYVVSIFRSTTRPHRTTRFILLIITAISAWSLLSNHHAGFWLAFASAIQAAILFIISFKRGMGGWARLDIACLLLALIGVVIWQLTGQPVVGLLASILADFIGYIPAYVKTYLHPETEAWSYFMIDTGAAVFSLLAVNTFTVYALSYPIYILLANTSMVVLILWRNRAINQRT